MHGWFQLNKPLLEAVRTMERRYTAGAVVNDLLAVFPEIEQWWQDRTVGPHLEIRPDDMRKRANAAKAGG